MHLQLNVYLIFNLFCIVQRGRIAQSLHPENRISKNLNLMNHRLHSKYPPFFKVRDWEREIGFITVSTSQLDYQHTCCWNFLMAQRNVEA